MEQNLLRPPGGPNEGRVVHPGATHRLFTTFTMPHCACVAHRDALKPGIAKLGIVGQPSILQRKTHKLIITFVAWIEQRVGLLPETGRPKWGLVVQPSIPHCFPHTSTMSGVA